VRGPALLVGGRLRDLLGLLGRALGLRLDLLVAVGLAVVGLALGLGLRPLFGLDVLLAVLLVRDHKVLLLLHALAGRHGSERRQVQRASAREDQSGKRAAKEVHKDECV